MAVQLVHVGELYDTATYGKYSAIDELIPTAGGGYRAIFERQTFKEDETRIDEDFVATVGSTGVQSGSLLKLAEDLRFGNSSLRADGTLLVSFGMRTHITIGTLGANGVVKTLYDTELTQIMEPPMSTSDGGVAYGKSGSIAVARIDHDATGKFRAVDVLDSALKVNRTIILDRDLKTDEAGSTVVTALSDGRFLITWVEVTEGRFDIVARVLTSTGKLVGTKFVAGTIDDGSPPYVNYEVTALPNGAFALSYQGQIISDYSSGIPGYEPKPTIRNLDGQTWIPNGADGFELGGRFHRDTEFKIDDLKALITLSDGRMVQIVSYTNQGSYLDKTPPDSIVRGHVYDSKGNYTGESFDLFQYKEDYGSHWNVLNNVRAVALEGGRFALIVDFSDSVKGQSSTVQIYALSSQPLARVRGATSGNDVLKGEAHSDRAESINGGSGDDRLLGYGGNDKLYGSDGKDLLDGGKGADLMVGGKGADIYLVDKFDDIVIEALRGGSDTVRSSIDYALGEHVEQLVLTGTVATDGRGNALDNVLTGNAAANFLDGGDGADVVRGLGGDDTYHVDNARDRVIESVGNGTDTVVTTVSFRLQEGQDIEVLKFDPSAFTNGQTIRLTGNSDANTLIGSGGKDVLNGREGSDILIGSNWVDTFVFDSALGKHNIDRITDFDTYLFAGDKIQLDDAIFKGLAKGALAVSAFKNTTLGTVDADDRILYNEKIGALFYDADGSGKAKAVQFAILGEVGVTTHPELTASHFFVI